MQRLLFDTDRPNWTTLERFYADDVRYPDPDGDLDDRAAVIAKLRAQREGPEGWTYEVRAT